MNTQAHRIPHPRLVVAGIVAILLSGLAITAMITAPKSQAETAAAAAVDVATAVRCAECGFVESMREVGSTGADHDPRAAVRVAQNGTKEASRKPVRRYEITVRMKDGSTRVFIDSAPVQWRPGERLILIGDAPGSSG
jgi:hypothetical protein